MSLNVEYRKGRPCETENCRSRLFYEDNGVLWCKNGHQQPGVEVEAYERIPTGGRKSKKKVEALERESRIYEGTKAIHLYIQSHQLILRKQVHALIHTHGFPAQLETVVHDLWALKLQLLGKKLNASGAILGNAETTDGEDGERLFSSQAESESGNGSGREKGGVGIDKDMPVLIETLGLCYLGAVLLRIPVLVASLVRWALREEIPYAHAIRLIPQSMKSRLPSYYIAALSVQANLDTTELHKTILRLVAQYDKCFSLAFPPLNYPPLLFWLVQQLALPLDIFNSIVQISKVLDGNFEFPKARFRQHLSSLPEVKLICILIVGVKLYQPFDGLPRYLRTADEIGILEIDWDKWSKLQQEQNSSNEEDDLQHKDPMQVSERDVFGMSNSQIDAYLDWYAETWIDEEPMHHGSKHIPEQLLNMFPIERLDGSTPVKPVFQPGKKVSYEPMLGNLKRAQESLKLRAVVSEGAEGKRTKPVRRIGDSYKHYRQVEDLSQHPHAKGFHDAVAKVTGIELSVLLRAVFRIERKLHRFWQDTQRTGGFGEEGGEGSDRQAEEVSDEELVSKEDAMATVVETDIEMED